MNTRIKHYLGAKFITESIHLLELSCKTRYKALMLFHYFSSKIDFIDICMASILIASKLEEEKCTIKRILYVFNHLHTGYKHKPEMLTYGQSIRMKERVIKAETIILKELGFNIQVENVYEDLIKLLENLIISDEVKQEIFAYVNTIFLWSESLKLNSRKIIEMSVEASMGITNEYTDFIKFYNELELQKVDFNTFEIIKNTKKIDEKLLDSFVKRHKKSDSTF